ncbi:MAG: hypothetical protein COZ34_01760 [Candidatus Pacebacteria bacterium CG_4_10_14_3_um_filter_34_15]|nr:hypothetical protein [Candidatus Paceibacterota bacterium]NCS86726.1 hypothetical protein [Candidatus Paceibacterota bacterium]OIO45127.1 MAG: hypothetical protein AUJ41_00700 [Candidatus Pacebacteria bacterium CG1_02_43_31]PIX81719.1 MAG: hypothetical protein COZ34_01760 [Candidatus Pacebacteria bacterium CG_4_10_14_3_um_filter_34_15]
MKLNKTKLYYITLITILGIKVVMTIFQGGLSAHHGIKIAQLKLQKNNLMQEQLKLTAELSQKNSISQIISDQDLAQFHSIGETIIITTNNNEVASR